MSGIVYLLLAHGRWFSPGTPVSSTTKTGRHDLAEILLKVALNAKNQIKSNYRIYHRALSTIHVCYYPCICVYARLVTYMYVDSRQNPPNIRDPKRRCVSNNLLQYTRIHCIYLLFLTSIFTDWRIFRSCRIDWHLGWCTLCSKRDTTGTTTYIIDKIQD